ncbi:hypothetical protein PsorP6_011733 [Peronosclerospora sorghi]|uniref:Uncharacterized protein n=1 Tax=Peronosclerospora sorghi TaxID=230839 RepID=A0ACC0WLG5_9STRA|nr:hypothetical protein PsorP6_011733 [Peronosclerospora sorghi]
MTYALRSLLGHYAALLNRMQPAGTHEHGLDEGTRPRFATPKKMPAPSRWQMFQRHNSFTPNDSPYINHRLRPPPAAIVSSHSKEETDIDPRLSHFY